MNYSTFTHGAPWFIVAFPYFSIFIFYSTQKTIKMWTVEKLAGIIDHTNVKPTATIDDIKVLCNEAKRYRFRGVCVQPCFVPLARELLKGMDIKVITVIGFPFGFSSTKAKVCETREALRNGADEVDMVMNIPMFKSKICNTPLLWR